MTGCDFLFLGYAPIEPYQQWPADWPFEWVASVDGLRPDNWVESWTWNRANCWSSEEEAWAVVAPGEASRYRMCAYRLWPVFLREGDEPRVRELDGIFDRIMDTPLPEREALDGFRDSMWWVRS